jgi:ribose transport system substrate-binding protein
VAPGAERAAHDLELAHGPRRPAILIACSDSDALTPTINAAADKGVAVMTFDSDAPASKRFGFYGTGDAEIGDKIMTVSGGRKARNSDG